MYKGPSKERGLAYLLACNVIMNGDTFYTWENTVYVDREGKMTTKVYIYIYIYILYLPAFYRFTYSLKWYNLSTAIYYISFNSISEPNLYQPMYTLNYPTPTI